MLVYRYEKEDGGGPFCTKDGYLRTNKSIKCLDNNYLSGCLSKELLIQYWNNQCNYEYYLKDCIIKIYDIPEEEIKYSASHIYFPKTYLPIN